MKTGHEFQERKKAGVETIKEKYVQKSEVALGREGKN